MNQAVNKTSHRVGAVLCVLTRARLCNIVMLFLYSTRTNRIRVLAVNYTQHSVGAALPLAWWHEVCNL
jgi:hypothetical protein